MKKYRLDLSRLKEHQGFFDYYKKDFNFQYLIIEGYTIPMYNDVLRIAADLDNYKLDAIYTSAFIDQYKRMSNIDTSTPEAKNFATHPMGDNFINETNLGLLKIGREGTWKLCAENTARAFKAWEVVIDNLTYFEKAALQQEESTFSDYLKHPNKEELMIKLHGLIDNTRTKNIVTVLKALENKNYIHIGTSNAKLYQAMRKEFSITITDDGANKFYFGNSSITENEIKNIENLLD